MYDFINLSLQFISIAISLLTLIIMIILNWEAIKSASNHDDFSNIKEKANIFSRRQFIIGLSGVTITLGTWGLFQFSFISRRIKNILYTFLPNGQQLVINKNSGVIHHKKICKDHLPKEKNLLNSPYLVKSIKFHQSKKINIINTLSREVSAEDAIELLMLAVENNPTSVHLYDNLIKLLGKIKRYESIHLLLKNAEDELVNKMKLLSKGTNEYMKYKKAFLHIRLRKEKVLMQARHSAMKI